MLKDADTKAKIQLDQDDRDHVRVIPKAVIQLMAHKWRPNAYDPFEWIFEEGDDDRRIYPSYYLYNSKRPMMDEIEAFSYEEICDLVRDGVLPAAVQTEGKVSVSEHAQHAVEAFMHSVYTAWALCEKRIAEAVKVQKS